MQEIWSVYFTLISHTLAIVTYRMDQNCGTAFPYYNGYGQISFKFSPYNASHYDCAVEVFSLLKLMVVFVDVNLPNSLCGEVNISLTKYYDYYERLDLGFSGIPLPLCKNNIPWSEFPSSVIEIKGSYFKVRFQGSPTTPQNTGFELKFVSYYYYGCESGTYKCKNYKCIPTSAHNCDDIDWCGDNSGCETNWGLIGGLIGGIGAAVLGVCIGGCLCCYIKKNQRSSWNEPSHTTPVALSGYTRRQNEQRARTQNSAYTISRNVRRLEPRNDISQNISRFEPRNDILSWNVNQYDDDTSPRHVPDLSPPSYASLQDMTPTTNDAAPPSNESSTEAGNQITGNQTEEYVPPPPEYGTVVQYKEIYKVTESDPTLA